ncbi:MAG TPA: hypothetical protein VGM88_33025 [Kofleriaceae bacterium]|jgi:hypothetical protein
MRLALDTTTLPHFAVNARGLLRWRVEASAPVSVELHATLAGAALPVAAAQLAPGAAATLAVVVTPAQAGYYELAGALVADAVRYTFSGVYLRVHDSTPHVNIVNIDQRSARVVDNSRSQFGGADEGGLLGDATWQDIALVRVEVPAPAPPPPVSFTIATERGTYTAHATLAHGDIATVFAARALDGTPIALKVADSADDNDLMQHEVRVLGLLLAEPDKTSIHFAPPRDQFRTSDGRLGTAFARLDGLDLASVRDRFRQRGEPGLPVRHVVWVLRRALAALGWAHKQGILHGNLDPAHILIRPHDHMLWLVDWCWAVVNPATTGAGFKALNETYSAPEVRERGRPTPASDLYALGKVAIFAIGGDPSDKSMPDCDPRFARFLRYLCVESQGGRGQDAWQLYLQIEKLRQQIWGDHEFLTLDL